MNAATPIDVSTDAIHAARSVHESLMASRYMWLGRDREPSYRDHFVSIAIDDLHRLASELGFTLTPIQPEAAPAPIAASPDDLPDDFGKIDPSEITMGR